MDFFSVVHTKHDPLNRVDYIHRMAWTGLFRTRALAANESSR